MLLSVLAFGAIALSLLVILRNWRMVAVDTAQSVKSGIVRLCTEGRSISNASFGLLWLMFFGLCFA
ncbi:hypothetical protein SAMN05421759_10468 [Roseivivax lentus]|uniref:Uncharacterized protein n=1 Tax=Roseivivax lentus TaxID=633194 RepID=A0A1N7M884_9RHOB|nr:hypothetical protein [Roseivivax lentus]SIS82233.1 hypothetical protein SAMN05421759_10468 [Roseivivax lentus]